MRIKITFVDGTEDEYSYCDSSVVVDGTLIVFTERHNRSNVRYPLTSIKKWETNP